MPPRPEVTGRLNYEVIMFLISKENRISVVLTFEKK